MTDAHAHKLTSINTVLANQADKAQARQNLLTIFPRVVLCVSAEAMMLGEGIKP